MLEDFYRGLSKRAYSWRDFKEDLGSVKDVAIEAAKDRLRNIGNDYVALNPTLTAEDRDRIMNAIKDSYSQRNPGAYPAELDNYYRRFMTLGPDSYYKGSSIPTITGKNERNSRINALAETTRPISKAERNRALTAGLGAPFASWSNYVDALKNTYVPRSWQNMFQPEPDKPKQEPRTLRQDMTDFDKENRNRWLGSY